MATTTKLPRYVLCISNAGCDDLRVRQVYRVIPDARSERAGMLRVVDDSGEDYLYPKGNFVRISIPPTLRLNVQKLFGVRAGQPVSRPRSKAMPRKKLAQV